MLQEIQQPYLWGGIGTNKYNERGESDKGHCVHIYRMVHHSLNLNLPTAPPIKAPEVTIPAANAGAASPPVTAKIVPPATVQSPILAYLYCRMSNAEKDRESVYVCG